MRIAKNEVFSNEQATQNTILKNTLKKSILKKGRKNKYYETKTLVIWLEAIPSTTTA
jgi:hypothetical protein